MSSIGEDFCWSADFSRVTPLRDVTLCHDDFDQESGGLLVVIGDRHGSIVEYWGVIYGRWLLWCGQEGPSASISGRNYVSPCLCAGTMSWKHLSFLSFVPNKIHLCVFVWATWALDRPRRVPVRAWGHSNIYALLRRLFVLCRLGCSQKRWGRHHQAIPHFACRRKPSWGPSPVLGTNYS